MPADTTIHPFPELREYAESEARARVVAFAAIEGDACAPDGDVSTVAAVELRLLCDLTRPASRDAVCRLIAAHQNVDVLHVHRTLRVARDVPEFAHLTHAEQLSIVVRHLWPKEAPHG